MPFKSWFKKLTMGRKREYAYAQMLAGTVPIFSQFGNDVYASDIVRVCIDRIAGQIGKLQPRHIFENHEGLRKVPKSTINRLFKYSPNPIMTTKDFLEKTVWLLYTNYNCFIYPTYHVVNGSKVYTGLYPLNPQKVIFLEDANGKLFVEISFISGDTFTIPYESIIHLRKGYSVNSLMGGGINGMPDNTGLERILEINNTLISGLGKAITSSLQVLGIYKIPTILNDDKTKKEVEKLEKMLENGNSGILPLSVGTEYTPIKSDPKMIDKETIKFIQDKILALFEVPYKIYTGEFTEEEYQAWYEMCLNPIIVGLNQAFTKTLFTDREIDVGNYIEFFPQDLNLLSMKSKVDLIKIAGEQGLLTLNDKRVILGLPPIEGGEARTISLNHVDVAIANEYQMAKAKAPSIKINE